MLCVFIIYVFIQSAVSLKNNLLLVKNEEYFLENCLMEIADTYFAENAQILLLSSGDYFLKLQHNLKWIYYVGNTNKGLFFFLDINRKINNYILVVENGSVFEKSLKTIKEYGLNFEGKFIVIFQNIHVNLEDIFQSLWKIKMLDSIVIMSNVSKKEARIFLWYPYLNNCGNNYNNTTLINVYRNGRFIKNQNLFPRKVPENFNKCPIRVRSVEFPPYVALSPGQTFTETIQNANLTNGFEVMMINTVGEVLNLTIIHTIIKIMNGWGSIKKDGTATGMMKALLEEEADVVMSCIEPTLERFKFFGYSISFISECLTWGVPSAELEAKWKCLIDIFQIETWLLTLIVLFITTIVVFQIGFSTKNEIKIYKRLSSCFSNTFSSLLSMSVKNLPKTNLLRSLFLLWLICGFVLSASFQTCLISVLTNPNYEKQIETMEEIIEKGISIGISLTHLQYFENTEKWIQDKYLEAWTNCAVKNTCFDKIAFDKDFALPGSRMFYAYLKNQKIYRDPNTGQPLIYTFKNMISTFPIQMLTIKGLPILPKMNDILFKIVESGLINKWFQDVSRNIDYKLNYATTNNEPKQNLTINHLQGAFMILGLGLFISLFLFIIEIIINKYFR